MLVKKADFDEFSKALFASEEFKNQLAPDDKQVKSINWTYVHYDGTDFNVLTKAKIEKLLKTYSAELKNVTADEFANGNAVGSIEYEIPAEKSNGLMPVHSYIYRRSPVFESCTETVKLIKQYRAEFEEAVKNADKGDETAEDNAENAETPATQE